MNVTIDNHGRIVIPKTIRGRFGLTAGSRLELSIESDSSGEMLTLRPYRKQPTLMRRDGVLVHTGKAVEPLDPTKSVQNARDTRMRQLDESSG